MMAATMSAPPDITEADVRGYYATAEIEETLIGVVLACGDAWSNTRQEDITPVLAMVEAQDFTEWRHRAIWQAILNVHAAGHPPHLVMVHAELSRTGALDQYGGAVELVDCMTSNTLRGDIAIHLARIVRTDALHRRLAAAASQNDAEGIERATQALQALGVVDNSDQFPTMREVASSYFDMMGDDSTRVVRVGIGGLDRTTGGFRPGNLVTIGARPAVGKSAIGITIAYNVAIRQGIPVGVISLEMSNPEIMQRLIAMDANVSTQEARTPTEAVTSSLGRIDGTPLYIRQPGSRITDVLAAAGPLVTHYGCQLIIIDYLQLMTAGQGDSRPQDLAVITRELKNWAQSQEVPLILLSQLKRETQHKGPPRLEDFAEGDAPARDSDIVLFLHPDDEDNAQATQAVDLIIAKHRNGPTGKFAMQFVRKTTRFTEQAWS